jgi:hypothetical protein
MPLKQRAIREPPAGSSCPTARLRPAPCSLFAFNNVLRVIGTFSSKAFAKTGGWQKAVQPVRLPLRFIVALHRHADWTADYDLHILWWLVMHQRSLETF